MILKEFRPHPALDSFVQYFRIVHFKFDKKYPLPCKIYPPKPENVLHFFLQERLAVVDIHGKKNYQDPITFIGQRTTITRQIPESGFLNFQVVFQPTAIYRLTGIPSTELTNQFINGNAIFSNQVHEVYEQLQEARTHQEMLAAGARFVTGLVRQARKEIHLLDDASSLMMRNNGNVSLDMLARESCLCSKQFKRKFSERAGLNPKLYSRIIRFNKALNIKNAYPCLDWLRIAIECGYFDYQHLVKDYKDLTGLSPNEYHLHETKSPERILGLTDELYQNRLQGFSPRL